MRPGSRRWPAVRTTSCVSARRRQYAAAIGALAARTGTAVTRIGRIEAGAGVELKLNNTVMQFSPLGFEHFRL
jgi:thiamine monophosphate kinase